MHEPLLTVGWPTAELGAMGLEGAVKLGFRRELEAIADEAERAERLEAMVAHAHEHAKALNAATLFELDDVIDPAETRRLLARDPSPRRPRTPAPRPRAALRRHLVSRRSHGVGEAAGSEPLASADAERRGPVALPVALDLGQGEVLSRDAVGEVVDHAERRVAQPELAGDHALGCDRHPDHVGVRGDQADLGRRLEPRPAGLPVDALGERLDPGLGERLDQLAAQRRVEAGARGAPRRPSSAVSGSASRAMKSSRADERPRPELGPQPADRAQREHPVAARVGEPSEVGDDGRSGAAAGSPRRPRGGGSGSTLPPAAPIRRASFPRSAPVVPSETGASTAARFGFALLRLTAAG